MTKAEHKQRSISAKRMWANRSKAQRLALADKVRNTLEEKYASGELRVWNAGKHGVQAFSKETKDKIGSISKRRWTDPKFRKKMTKVHKRVWKDEVFRELRHDSLCRAHRDGKFKNSAELITNAWADGRYVGRDSSLSGRPKGSLDSKPRVYTEAGFAATKGNTIKRGVHGSFQSKKNKKLMYYDSKWELARMEVLEASADVESYRREPVQIPYKLNGKAHYYHPDLLVCYWDGTHVIEEIKPLGLIKEPVNRAKFKAARAFCKTAGLEFRLLTTLESCHEE